MVDEPLPRSPLLEPHRWARLPHYSAEQVYNALLTLEMVPAWHIVLTQLVVTYLLAHPEDMRGVGKQDVVRELMDMQQQALLWRQQQSRGEETDGRDDSEWFPESGDGAR